MLSNNVVMASGLAFVSLIGVSAGLVIQTPVSSDPVQALVDINGTEYASSTSYLISSGYRPLSLSVYGSPARYTSVWAKDQTIGSIETIQDADYNTYSAWLDKLNDEGYVSTHVSASGATTGEAVFTGIMEKKDVGFWLQQCDQDSPWAIQNATSGYQTTMASFAMYGVPNARKFCVTLHENPNNTQETSFMSSNDYTVDFDTVYNGQITKRFWRPTRLFQSAEHVITPIFQDTRVGKWQAFFNLTADELKSEITSQKHAGRIPIDISGGGYGADDIIFSAIFAEKSTPEEKQWNAVGTITGFIDNDGVRALLDSRIQKFMQSNSIRQAQVAAAFNGTIIAERAYTLAEADYPIVDTKDKFMLASVSKMYLYAAVTKLVDEGRLQWWDKPYGMLGYTQFADRRSENITVRQLLDHEGGFDRSCSGDPMVMFRTIALELGLNHPATLKDVIDYMANKPLDFAPGSNSAYSNYGPMLLSYLVSNITGMEYLDYLKTNIFGDEDVILYTTDAVDHINDTVVQQTKNVGFDPRILDREVIVAGTTGGDGIIKEEIVGTASLATSASSLVQFIGSHAAWGTGGRTESNRDGTLDGCRSFVYSMFGGVDMAFVINSREYKTEIEWQNVVLYEIPDVWNTFERKPEFEQSTN